MAQLKKNFRIRTENTQQLAKEVEKAFNETRAETKRDLQKIDEENRRKVEEELARQKA